MCLILFAFRMHPKYPLVLLANRDEFYERPTRAARYWEDAPGVYAGRDLIGGGTWMGVNDEGRFAAVTNYREPQAMQGLRSRGELVADFLRCSLSANEHLSEIATRADEYSGFNLLVGEFQSERAEIAYFSNRENVIRKLESGIYGLSNHLLDTPWPKVRRGRERMSEAIRENEANIESYFEILSDRETAPDAELPSTGLPYTAENALSAAFIETPGYGTRCSTMVRFDETGRWEFEERVFV